MSTETNKPREFWIVNDYVYPSTFNDEKEAKSYCECVSRRDEYGYDVIHVIEKSAYDSLKSQLDEANEMIAELEKALEFYADEGNWMITRKDNLHTAKMTIIADARSYGHIENPGEASTLLVMGGKTAEEALAKLKEWRGK